MAEESPSIGGTRPPSRRWAWGGLLLIVIGGMLIWKQFVPVECALAFDIPPTVRNPQGKGLTRKDIRGLQAEIHDAAGQLVARSVLDLPEGVKGPVAPPVVLRLPKGHYTARVHLKGTDGLSLYREARFSLVGDGFQRVEFIDVHGR